MQTRRENAAKKRQLVTRKIEHRVRDDQKVCPRCGGHDFTPLGAGAMTELHELVPAMVERQLHIQEKLRRKCGEGIVTADPPEEAYDKRASRPTFMAQVVVSKCADSLPLRRQAKAYRRVGVQANDSTLGDLVHRTAELTKPLSDRLLELPEKEIVLADETTHRVQDKGEDPHAWLCPADASGPVASRTCGGSSSTRSLHRPRLRSRRWTSSSRSPDRTRRPRCGPARHARAPRHAADPQPRWSWTSSRRGSIPRRRDAARSDGEAISYALGHWTALTLFLTDPHLPIDDNASERALRVSALGRKNFLSSGTTRPVRTWPASTRSSRHARRRA